VVRDFGRKLVAVSKPFFWSALLASKELDPVKSALVNIVNDGLDGSTSIICARGKRLAASACRDDAARPAALLQQIEGLERLGHQLRESIHRPAIRDTPPTCSNLESQQIPCGFPKSAEFP
jgi:hypothetical protein